MIDLAVDVLNDLMGMAIPIAIVFEFGNLIVGTFLRVAFGGVFRIGR